jgi:hypothetical protein
MLETPINIVKKTSQQKINQVSKTLIKERFNLRKSINKKKVTKKVIEASIIMKKVMLPIFLMFSA